MDNEDRSIYIDADPETVWHALTNEDNFSAWYAPGSVWRIPELEAGCKALFTLMPSEHNQLEEGEHIDMSFTITEVVPYSRFSYKADEDELHFIFDVRPENTGSRVTVNMDGFELSLENLKAFAEGRELPNM